MRGQPSISPIFKAAAGGLPQVLEALRCSEDSEIQQFLDKYDSLRKMDARLLTWEQIAVAAGVNLSHFLGNGLIAFTLYQKNLSEIKLLSNHPKIMDTRIRAAKKMEGRHDRDAVDTMLGFLPSSKGTNIVNRIQVANLTNPEKPSKEVYVGDDIPLAEDTLHDLHSVRQHVLTAGR